MEAGTGAAKDSGFLPSDVCPFGLATDVALMFHGFPLLRMSQVPGPRSTVLPIPGSGAPFGLEPGGACSSKHLPASDSDSTDSCSSAGHPHVALFFCSIDPLARCNRCGRCHS